MKIELLGKFFDNHSLSIINRNIAFEMHKQGMDIAITPLDSYNNTYKLDVKDLEILDTLKNKEIKEPDVQIRHCYPPIWRYPFFEKTKVVFIQPWEFSRIPFEWQYKFEMFADGLFVPSNWVKDRFLESGINPQDIFVVPNGYDPNIYNIKKREKNKKLTFIFVGNNQYRKGLDILLNVWQQTFKKADYAKLIIKDNPYVYGPTPLLNDIIKIQYKSNCAEIVYNDKMLSEEEMAQLYQGCDIIVHPYRGEGFGMPVQEAMACGVFPLVSRHGATDDFVTDSCGVKIETERKLIAANPTDFVMGKPGDSFTLMHQYTWVNEPIAQDLASKIYNIYHLSNRQKMFSCVEEAKLNPWNQVATSYISYLEKIVHRNSVKRFK